MINNIEKIFRYFALNLNKNLTIRQLSTETKIPYMTLNRIVKKLEKRDLITTKNVGNSIVCSLNKSNIITKQHIILASESFSSYLLEKKPLIKKIQKIIEEKKPSETSTVLFGSYALGKEQKYSDIDLVFVSNFKRKIKKILNEFKTIERIHDIEINFMIFTEMQFKEMLKSKEENVGKQILNNHIVLYNPELFWNLVYEVML